MSALCGEVQDIDVDGISGSDCTEHRRQDVRAGRTVRLGFTRAEVRDGPSAPMCGNTVHRDALAAARAYRTQGVELYRAGNAPAAASEWERGLGAVEDARGRAEGDDVRAVEQLLRANLAQACLVQHRFEKAQTHAKAALALDENCAKARYRLVEACVGLGSWDEAEEHLAHLDRSGQAGAAARGRKLLRDRRREARAAEQVLAAKMLGQETREAKGTVATHMSNLDSMD